MIDLKKACALLRTVLKSSKSSDPSIISETIWSLEPLPHPKLSLSRTRTISYLPNFVEKKSGIWNGNKRWICSAKKETNPRGLVIQTSPVGVKLLGGPKLHTRFHSPLRSPGCIWRGTEMPWGCQLDSQRTLGSPSGAGRRWSRDSAQSALAAWPRVCMW